MLFWQPVEATGNGRRWEVYESAGELVGLIVERHPENESATFTAAHNPTGDPFGADWRQDGYRTVFDRLAGSSDGMPS